MAVTRRRRPRNARRDVGGVVVESRPNYQHFAESPLLAAALMLPRVAVLDGSRRSNTEGR